MEKSNTIHSAEQKFHDASVLFVILMCGVTAWILFYAFWLTLGRPLPIELMVQAENVLGVILLLLALRYTSFSCTNLGLWSNEPKKIIKNSLFYCLIAFIVLGAVKFAGQLYAPSLFHTEHGFFDVTRFNLYQVTYIFTAFMQEFIARCALQANLKRIAIRNASAYSIIMSSLIFAVFHIQYGFWFMIGAAILGGVLGIIYDKQNTIIGIWLIHWFTGVAAYLFGIIAN